MKTIEILGSGCPKCKALAANAQAAAAALGIEVRIEKITDPRLIAHRGVMLTPALAVDGEVKLTGYVADTEEIKKLLA
jgi:small redox-active disulfide protein 2